MEDEIGVVPYKSNNEIGNTGWELAEFEQHLLRNRREELKMTQQQVADRANILLSQYQRFELGDRSFIGASARIMLSVCKALKLDPYLFMGEDRSASKQLSNNSIKHKYVILPPPIIKGTRIAIPEMASVIMTCQIPYGFISTNEIIEEQLKAAYSVEYIQYEEYKDSVRLYYNNGFPYWRVVSKNGHLRDTFYFSKELQKERLEEEGISVKQIGNQNAYSVDSYKKLMYGFKDCKLNVAVSNEQFYAEFVEYYKKKHGEKNCR